MSPWLIAGGIGLGLLLFGGATAAAAGGPYVPARDLTRTQALDILRAAGVVKREALSAVGTISVSSKLGGVTYRYMGHNRGAEEMAPQTAVLLLRLGEWLHARYGVMIVDHKGVYPGKSPDAGNAHNRGMAVDFATFVGADGRSLDVTRDWGNKPPRADRGYRLTPADTGFEFFAALYDFLSSEVTNGGSLGGHGYLLTPDHLDPAVFGDHQDHVHAQLGPTTTTPAVKAPPTVKA